MIIAWMPVAVAIAGALLYALAGNAKVQELGRLLFFAGVFWFVYAAIGKTFRIG